MAACADCPPLVIVTYNRVCRHVCIIINIAVTIINIVVTIINIRVTIISIVCISYRHIYIYIYRERERYHTDTPIADIPDACADCPI